jgi:hypothetical protein
MARFVKEATTRAGAVRRRAARTPPEEPEPPVSRKQREVGRHRWRPWSKISAVLGALVLVSTAYGFVSGDIKSLWNHLFPPAVSAFEVTPELGLSFTQNGHPNTMEYIGALSPSGSNNVEVMMNRGPFEMLFPKLDKDYGYAICASLSSKVFKVASGASASTVDCFAMGHGGAETEYSDGQLALDPDAFNYMIDKRVQPAPNDQVKAYFSSVVVNPLTPAEKIEPLTQQRASIYLEVTETDPTGAAIGQAENIELRY